jgi:phosphate transport system substrate-binding protein
VSPSRWLAVIASLAILAVGVAACGDDEEGSGSGDLSGQIAGAGSSAQEAAQEAWRANFQKENEGATVTYDPVGSGGGREQFVAGGTAFGGTDAALEEEEGELKGAMERCEPGELIQIPDYVSPIAVIYNLPSIEELKLAPETMAKIFNQEITQWDDKEIAEENPEAELPSTRITPVNRSDESGTTENFVDYLSKVAPNVWTYDVTGDWPVKGGEAAQGTSGVVEAVGAGEGTIGYADASQAGELGVALVKVGEDYVGPTPEAAAQILEESPEDEEISEGRYVFAFELDRKTEAEGTYPIVLVSYLMACTAYGSADEAELVKGYLEYVVSPDGQEAAAENAGSAPITEGLREKVEPAIEAIEAS